jgi:DNA-binding transcriptional regulator of glucitol operon
VRLNVKMGWLVVTHFSSVAQCSSNALNVSGAVLDGAWVEAMAETEIPAVMTYKQALVSHRRAGGTVKARFSFKTVPDPVSPPD